VAAVRAAWVWAGAGVALIVYTLARVALRDPYGYATGLALCLAMVFLVRAVVLATHKDQTPPRRITMTLSASALAVDSQVLLLTDAGNVTISVEDAYGLANTLLHAVRRAELPALMVEGDETVCPHCGYRVLKGTDVGPVTEYDNDARGNGSYVGYDKARDISIVQSRSEYLTVAYSCSSCSKFVALPPETFNITWS
jgi:hypothetical protein